MVRMISHSTVKVSATILAALALGVGCSPSSRHSDQPKPVTPPTNEKKPDTTVNPAEVFDIAGYPVQRAEEMDEKTAEYVSSIKSVYLQEEVDAKSKRKVYHLLVVKTDGREVAFSGKMAVKATEAELPKTADSAGEQAVDQFGPARISCGETCEQVRVEVPVSVSGTVVTPTVYALMETAAEGSEVGVKNTSNEVTSQLFDSFKAVSSVQRSFAYVDGSNTATLTYTLRDSAGTRLLSVGVSNRGTQQTPRVLFHAATRPEAQQTGGETPSVAFKSMTFDAAPGQVHTLKVVQSDDVAVTVALGFRSPLDSKPIGYTTPKLPAVNSNPPSVSSN